MQYGPAAESCEDPSIEKVQENLWRHIKTSQELRMLSSVTLNCQVAKIVMESGSQLSEL